MTDVKTVINDLLALNDNLSVVDAKLDEVRAIVDRLEAGSLSDEDLTALQTAVSEGKEKSAALVTETDDILEPKADVPA